MCSHVAEMLPFWEKGRGENDTTSVWLFPEVTRVAQAKVRRRKEHLQVGRVWPRISSAANLCHFNQHFVLCELVFIAGLHSIPTLWMCHYQPAHSRAAASCSGFYMMLPTASMKQKEAKHLKDNLTILGWLEILDNQ